MKIVLFGALIGIAHAASGQQFGRNKPHYDTFDFKEKESGHFKLFHYLPDSVADRLLQTAERWYDHERLIFRDTFKTPNPVIIYANHADFQQTTTISGNIGVGTGGVTEAFRNRVVMPVMELNSQTEHVLGHELVHAFQYKLVQRDSLTLSNLQNIPLWMVEGLAEYLSIGSVDPHTAMWMRDAIVHNDFPTLRDMTRSYRYFPYRYGQSFWSFVTGIYGDSIVYPLFRTTAFVGYDAALKRLTGLDEKAFSSAWKEHLTNYYGQFKPLEKDTVVGTLLVDPKESGDLNIAPVISPNGQYIAFLSQKNFFSIDLFLADAKTGKILRTLSTVAKQRHIDDFSYIESAPTWSPGSDRIAFTVFSEGRTKLSIVDLRAGYRSHTLSLPGLSYFSNPAWSPDGEHIVVSGLKDGQGDLYLYNLRENKVLQLTDDTYSDIQPQWAPDGGKIIFVSDRPARGRTYNSKSLQLVTLDLSTRQTEIFDIFHKAENLNPVFSPDGNSVYFLSNRDGYRNLYRYNPVDDSVFRLTDYVTGITGITAYSPALTVSRGTGLMAYTHYTDGKYMLYTAHPSQFNPVPVDIDDVDFSAGTLPPAARTGDIVNAYVLDMTKPSDTAKMFGESLPYKPRVGLEYIGNQINVGVSNQTFAGQTGMAGGVNMMFGDMLGYHKLYATAALNGEIYDFGGQVAYVNQRGKLIWGTSLSHIPYRSSYLSYRPDTLYIREDTLHTVDAMLDVYRTFEKSVSFFGYLPLSTTQRFELGVGYALYSFRLDRFHNHFYGQNVVKESREKLEAPRGYGVGSVYGAYVFDNSFFGIASPLRGKRYRLEVSTKYDVLDFTTVMADYRQYVFLNPTSLAFRVLHMSRHGRDAENSRIYPLSFAYPTLTRGNSFSDISRYGSGVDDDYSIEKIFGSRLLVANVEWRVPFTGPERLTPVKSRLFFTELAFFADAGMAWNKGDVPSVEGQANGEDIRKPFVTTGVSMRVNLFGALVIEPYMAFPLRHGKIGKGIFGVNFTPGW